MEFTKTKIGVKKMIISRTDSIGDVMLTLPICVWLKKHFPEFEIIYLGKNYTKAIIDCFQPVDRFLNWDDILALPSTQRVQVFKDLNAEVIIHVFPNKEIASLAKKAKIPTRIGTSHRSFHLLTCNQRVSFTRKKSDLHESQLNFELLRPLGLEVIPTLNEIQESLRDFNIPQVLLPLKLDNAISEHKNVIILHPKSQGSAVEWPMENYIALAKKLVEREFLVFFTGTEKEGEKINPYLPNHPSIISTCGQLALSELIVLISKANYFVACSTGPLHIAGFLGLRTIGLFVPKRPIHPGRWGAIGKHTINMVYDVGCKKCKSGKKCNCINDISVDSVLEQISA